MFFLLISILFFSATLVIANVSYEIERFSYPKDYPPCMAIVSYEFCNIANLILTSKAKIPSAAKNKIDQYFNDFVKKNAECIKKYANDDFTKDLNSIEGSTIDEKITYLKMRYKEQSPDRAYKILEKDGTKSYYLLPKAVPEKTNQPPLSDGHGKNNEKSTVESMQTPNWIMLLVFVVYSILLSYFVITNIKLKKAISDYKSNNTGDSSKNHPSVDEDLHSQNQQHNDNGSESPTTGNEDLQSQNQEGCYNTINNDKSVYTTSDTEVFESQSSESHFMSQTADYDKETIICEYNKVIENRANEKPFIHQWKPDNLSLANYELRRKNSDILPEFAKSDYRESDFWLVNSNEADKYFLLPSYRMFEKGTVFYRGGIVANHYLNKIFKFQKAEDFRVISVAILKKTQSLEVIEEGELEIPIN
jgi:hypothetical protein